MYENEILKEKDRVQKELADSATDIHDYLVRSNQSAKEFFEKHGYEYQTQKPEEMMKQTKKAGK